MYNKKRVSILVILIVVSIMLVGFVSAGWFSDLFKLGEDEGLEGELPVSAPARVNVTGVPEPKIIFVSGPHRTDVVYNGPSANTEFNFSFIACTLGPLSTLPGTIAFPNVTYPWSQDPDAGARGNFTKTGEATRGTTRCDWKNDLGGYVPCGTGYNAKIYSCSVNMYFFNDPGTWTITIQILDIYGSSGINNTKTFDLQIYSSFDIQPKYLNWSSVTAGAQNRIADNNITVYNQGNIDIDDASKPFQVNGTELRGELVTTETIAVGNFTVGTGSTICDTGDRLIQDVNITVSPFIVDHDNSIIGTRASNISVYCLDVPAVSTQSYNASRLWELTVIF